ncbi:MAG TPA: PEF-CTERM sorting domain-containing protein [Candidatus Methanoperedens sp.]
MRNTMTLIIGMFAVLISMTGLAAAVLEEDPVLWVVPENPTAYSNTNPDPLLQQTVIQNVNMGTTFSGNVLVLNQESYGNPKADALSVKLMFFVKDKSNIDDITIGTAQRIQKGSPPIITDPNINSTPAAQTLVFGDYSDPPGPAYGYNVTYLIGDIPFSGGPSVTGDPQTNLNSFNPYNGEYLIKVPFTIRFKTQPEAGFVLYAFANNSMSGKYWAHTAYSHDGGFYYQIPEFSTVAIPVVSIIGLLLYFQQKKKKE